MQRHSDPLGGLLCRWQQQAVRTEVVKPDTLAPDMLKNPSKTAA